MPCFLELLQDDRVAARVGELESVIVEELEWLETFPREVCC